MTTQNNPFGQVLVALVTPFTADGEVDWPGVEKHLDDVINDGADGIVVTGTTGETSTLTDPEKIKQFQDAQNQLSGALGRLIAVSEAYPDLKSNQNFLALQSQLEGTENRIAVARRDYVAAVRDYNLTLSTFPSIIWAKTIFAGKQPMATFTASEGADMPPQVKF